MKVRVNTCDSSLIYLIPENDEEKKLLAIAWRKNKLKHHITSFSSSGELGVFIGERDP